MHETRYHDSSIFVTLTYAPEHLPADGHLVPRDLALFLKKLRKAMALRRLHLRGERLRYLASGEYGDLQGRPHYHAIIFGLGLDDGHLVRGGDLPLYESPTLRSIWGKGSANYGEVTAASAAYTAAYTFKKLGEVHCDADGVVKPAPFLRCSTRPGIGAFYASCYASDFRTGTLVSGDTAGCLPRYYKKILERDNADIAEEAAHAVYTRQRERVERDPLGASPDRLVAAEKILKARRALTHKPEF